MIYMVIFFSSIPWCGVSFKNIAGVVKPFFDSRIHISQYQLKTITVSFKINVIRRNEEKRKIS